jgi:hypothetical protein
MSNTAEQMSATKSNVIHVQFRRPVEDLSWLDAPVPRSCVWCSRPLGKRAGARNTCRLSCEAALAASRVVSTPFPTWLDEHGCLVNKDGPVWPCGPWPYKFRCQEEASDETFRRYWCQLSRLTSIERGMLLTLAFSLGEPPRTMAELAERARCSRATAFRVMVGLRAKVPDLERWLATDPVPVSYDDLAEQTRQERRRRTLQSKRESAHEKEA